MLLLALDLELNQPSGSIIEIGIALGNTETGELLGKQNWLTYLPNDEQLNPMITMLTGIKQEDLNIDLFTAFKELCEFRNSPSVFINPLVWGQGDVQALLKQVHQEDNIKLFGRRQIDAKTLYVSWRMANNKPVAGGLSKAMTKFGLKFKGKKHRAADDAENTFYIYCKMLEYLKV